MKTLTFLTALFAVSLLSLLPVAHTRAEENTPLVVATTDWTVAETLIALGKPPVAVGDALSYRRWVAEPVLPPEVVDLGIRLQPNPEQIWLLKQTLPHARLLFINSPFYAGVENQLAKHGSVKSVNFQQSGRAWQDLLTATRQIAAFIGDPPAAEQLIADFDRHIAALKPQAVAFTDRPLILAQFIDSRHLRIYAENSPLGAVLTQLGFRNAWQGSHNLWGFETVSITELAKFPPNIRFVVVKPYPADVKTALTYNTLWQKLPLTQDPLILPPVWTFGGMPSARRFADVLLNALQYGGETW